MAPPTLRIGRFRFSLVEGVGIVLLVVVACIALSQGLLWPVLIVVPLLYAYALICRMDFGLAEVLVLLAMIGLSIALSLPAVETHCHPGQRIRSGERPPISVPAATPIP